MSKILVMPPSVDDIDKLIDIGIDGFILGIKNFSFFFNFEIKIEDLPTIVSKIKKSRKEVFIALNKIIYNKELPLLKEYLRIINDLDIDGILYDDVSIVNLKEELNLKIKLVWNQHHLPTNYYTCNYWYKHGVHYAFLSSEISLDEIINIRKNTDIKLMTNLYGYLPMTVSSRSLLSNYFEYIDKKKEDKQYYLYDNDRASSYPIYEDENGTYILSSSILNGLKEMPILVKNNIDYIVLNGLYIDSNTFIKTSEIFVKALNDIDNDAYINELSLEISNISNAPTDKGFLYKETIYRVKTNE